ncbi:ABC transporter ATP-binding protein [Candidatus Harpocratesius sp.]
MATMSSNNGFIRCLNITKKFKIKTRQNIKILSSLSLEVKKGENLVIIGPNGAGKTTLLKIIGLLETPTDGKIFFDSHDLDSLTFSAKLSLRRKIAFVHQKPIVLNTSVKKNLIYPLKIRKFNSSEIEHRVSATLKLLDMKNFADHNARQLSGGEMQRIAIAMSLIYDPDILLFDEITANLDPKNYKLIETLIQPYLTNPMKTVIFTTHDPIEAIKFGDRIAVLNEGRIFQVDVPEKIFTNPADSFTAHFVGYENIFEGIAQYNLKTGINFVKINDISIAAAVNKEGQVKACIRPESIVISRNQPESISFRNILSGTIEKYNDLGTIFHVFVKVSQEIFLVSITKNAWKSLNLSINTPIFISFKATDVRIL